jgi:hypothetical protein
MQYAWTGKWPENRVPVMRSLKLDGQTAYESIYLTAGEAYKAETEVEDREGDALTYRWEILREVERDKQSDGGDFEPRPEAVLDISNNDSTLAFAIAEPGEYRLFVYAKDGNGGAATANVPFKVKAR